MEEEKKISCLLVLCLFDDGSFEIQNVSPSDAALKPILDECHQMLSNYLSKDLEDAFEERDK